MDKAVRGFKERVIEPRKKTMKSATSALTKLCCGIKG